MNSQVTCVEADREAQLHSSVTCAQAVEHTALRAGRWGGTWTVGSECAGLIMLPKPTMTILAYNLYYLLAAKLPGYTQYRVQSPYDAFIENYSEVLVGSSVAITV